MAKWKEPEIRKTAYILVGVPCSGKTTYRKKLIKNNFDVHVMSFDEEVKLWSKNNDITYSEFHQNMREMPSFSLVSKHIEKYSKEYISTKKPETLIVDKTNVHSKSRKKIITWLKHLGYYVVVVVFPKPKNSKETNIWFSRVSNRKEQPISDGVLIDFYQNYEYPNLETENFDEMIVIRDNWK